MNFVRPKDLINRDGRRGKLGISRTALYRLIAAGKFPPPVQQREVDFLRSKNAHPDWIERARPKIVDLEWLSEKLSQLRPIQRKAVASLERHQGGVVFALRLKESDLADMRYDSGMGIKAWTAISPDRIVSRVDVPIDFVYDRLAIKNDFDLCLMRSRSGAVERLCNQSSTVEY